MIRGALVGCGFFAKNHLHAWHMIEDAEIVAVCDVNEKSAKTYAESFNIPHYYTDAERMFKTEQLDFVDIVTQARGHLPLTNLAASHNINVICQKPLAPGMKEARQIVQACRHITFMVHENFRWQRPMLAVQEASKNIGELFFGRISFRTAHDIFAVQPYLATDERFIIYDLGVHLFDLARFFFGEASLLSCHTSRINPEITAEDVATALLRMKSGAQVILDMSYASKLEQDIFPQTLVHLEGRTGSVKLDANYKLSISTTTGTVVKDVPPRAFDWTQAPAHAVPESVLTIQRHFVDCLAKGKQPDTSGEDNLKTLELTFGAYQAEEQGQTLSLNSA